MNPDLVSVVTLGASPFIGSTLSVLVSRLPEREQVVWGRSRCDLCGHFLTVRDLVPVISFLALRGRCRHCGASIARHHIILELGAIAIALWAVLEFNGALVPITACLGWALLALAAMDYRRFFLSDYLTLPLVLGGLAVHGTLETGDLLGSALGAGIGFGAIWAVGLVFKRVRGVEGIGMGDAKLLAAAGAWTTWMGLGGVLLIAVVVTALHALLLSIKTGALDWRVAVPFGPGLCLGLWLTWIYGPLTLQWT
jgi:leader peptidase (prepilin peptidase) / N-methyltransferase